MVGPVHRPRGGHRIGGQTVKSSLSHTPSSISFSKGCPCNKFHIYSTWRRQLQAPLNVWVCRVDLVGLTDKSKQKAPPTVSRTQCSSDRQLHWILRRPENFAKTIGHFRNLHRMSESARGWKKCWPRIQFPLWHGYGINYSDSGGAHVLIPALFLAVPYTTPHYTTSVYRAGTLKNCTGFESRLVNLRFLAVFSTICLVEYLTLRMSDHSLPACRLSNLFWFP